MRLDTITTAAKAKIFELLVRFNAPLCLRDISSLSQISLRSTQLALRDFQQLKAVRVSQESNRTLYRIVRSPSLEIYRALFENECREKIALSAKKNARRALQVIPRIEDLHEMSSAIDQIKGR